MITCVILSLICNRRFHSLFSSTVISTSTGKSHSSDCIQAFMKQFLMCSAGMDFQAPPIALTASNTFHFRTSSSASIAAIANWTKLRR